MKNDSLNADNTTSKINSLWENQNKIVPIPPIQSLKLHGDNTIQKLLAGNLDNAAKEKLLARTMKVLDTEDAANAMRRLFMLGEAYSVGKMTRTFVYCRLHRSIQRFLLSLF